MDWLEKIDKNNVPQHVAIIMDGNGRWARKQGEERIFGHFNGVEAVRASLKAARNIGVKFLTLYAFSTENWNRPTQEVNALMDLLVKTIVKELEELDNNGVRLRAIGDMSKLPEDCHSELQHAMAQTALNTEVELILALSYSSRWEIEEAIRQMITEGVAANDVNSDTVSRYLQTADFPDPELMIRTSGEQRISNFLLWQLAYSELYFTDVLWPDFNEAEFYKAICDYQSRERRFGKTSEQIIV
ncbi:MAG: isoprenyl transferase [Flavobacteriales bacterium]|nr:isoprenyl transferase [Flavobacteriales bacterium]